MRIGIDIGGTTAKLGLVEGAEILDKGTVRTDGGQTPEAVMENIASAAAELLRGQPDCECIGIACAGLIDSKTGVVLYSNNLAWEEVPIVELLGQYISIPAALANDADAAALGEVMYGAAKGKDSAVLLTLGTGVGGGVVIGRRIFSGSMRGGCELGHVVIERNGKMCTCGRKGCLETYASATALMELARETAAGQKESLMNTLCGNNLAKLDGKMVFDAARQGDGAALQVVDGYEENLSVGIANVINIFRPEIVLLGGGVSAQGAFLTDALQKKVENLCFGGCHGDIPPIVAAQLGNDAGMIGAAYLR